MRRRGLGKQHWCDNCMVSVFGPKHRRCRGITRQRGKRYWKRYEQ